MVENKLCLMQTPLRVLSKCAHKCNTYVFILIGWLLLFIRLIYNMKSCTFLNFRVGVCEEYVS